MKKSQIISLAVISFVVVSSALYTISHKQLKATSLQDITYISQVGKLENGRRYEFFGLDKHKFDLKDYIDKFELKYTHNYNTKKLAATPKEAAEIAQLYFGLNETPIENADINVYYDIKTDNWVLIEKESPKVLRLGGFCILTIQRSDGLAKKYFDGFK